MAAGSASPSGPASASTCARSRGSSHGSARYGGWTVRRSRSSNPASRHSSPRASSAGHGRSGLTWSGVTGLMPPKSSTPASSRARHSVRSTRFGGAWTRRCGPQHDARGGDRRQVLLQPEVVDVPHRGLGLGPEVLDDHLLHVPELARDLPQREDALRPLGEGLADAHEQTGGERDVQPPGVLQHPHPHCRILVGAAVVRLALLLEQAPRRGLEHHPHRGRHGLQPVHLRPAHHPGVEVRQESGLLEHQDRHGAHVLQRRLVARLGQPRLRLRPPVLRPVAEGEQRLLAAHRRTGSGDLQHLVGRQERSLDLAGHRHERAVVAAVAAQPGERDEHLARVRDDIRTPRIGEARIAHPAGHGHEAIEVVPASSEQRGGLRDVDALGALGSPDGACDLPRARHRPCPVILIPACVL